MPGPDIAASVPHSARVWNYWLGGKDNYAVDREIGDQVFRVFPGIVANARAQRHFLSRAVRHLVTVEGVRQFLDVGTGLPSAGNTHEVAQHHAPGCRVVYVDNDPVVLAHARALLTGEAGDGATAYVEADVRDPDKILAAAAATLDLDRPVALMLLGILGHIADDERARTVVTRLVGGLCPGSFLTIADGTDVSPAGNEAQRRYNEASPVAYHLRSPERLAAFFAGLELIEPGVVPVPLWRPDPHVFGDPVEVEVYGGVARKP